MNAKHLLFCLAGGLALASCSSEPSDFRPGQKVSLDMVAPGTRSSQNFDILEEHAEEKKHDNGGIVERPISSHAEALDKDAKPTAEHSTTAKGAQVEATKNVEEDPDAALTQDGDKH
ncbi:hypothetical protein LRS06_10750 [Hymenobacter sp. J193]|uniref:hypothetical protein n=1 Tax=Hymenobacter sp. J193 TaxID=2898429 RepID=UPI002150A426|nr:hypothetical protein [Hymenobacter sp. J193]MCR5888235.1 hypothetical protein [Hymenobacter sp. J193]